MGRIHLLGFLLALCMPCCTKNKHYTVVSFFFLINYNVLCLKYFNSPSKNALSILIQFLSSGRLVPVLLAQFVLQSVECELITMLEKQR